MNLPFGAAAYVSYARMDEERGGTVSSLQSAFDNTWLTLKVDNEVIRPRENFKDFIEQIGRADCIVVLFSDAYFKSFYCMLELTRILEHSKGDKSILDKRVVPIFLDECRLDNKQRLYKHHWEQTVLNWQVPFEELEVKEEYGSIEECEDIVAAYDSIFDLFAYNQAYEAEPLKESNFELVIEQSKNQYFHACDNSPLLKEAQNHLESLSQSIKTVFIRNFEDCNNEKEALWQLLSNDAKGIFQKIEKIQTEISSSQEKYKLGELLKHIAPLVLHVTDFNSFKLALENGRQKITPTGCAHELSAEFRMAVFNERPADYYVQEMQNKRNFVLGKYSLGEPPEVGEDKEGNKKLRTITDHILNFTGLDARFCRKAFLQQAHNSLYQDFVPNDLQDDAYELNERIEDVSYYLSINSDQYYLIVKPNDENEWLEFAKQLSAQYPEIVVLQLSNDPQQKRREGRLLDPLRNITQ